ncbi:MAG: PAS domain-containing sensor histidine kinase [Desulfobacterales bacterium]|nr:PAS domain-containing sensor histidine kinase [Desulfobacterales bacterium]
MIVLFPIFTFITIENLNIQKKHNTKILLEKGTALIRSFEAGTRTGMMGMEWNIRQLQRLLTEMAKQPDIVYLLLTNIDGKIIAHDQIDKIGTLYANDLDLKSISNSNDLNWREIKELEGNKVFEVFRKFSPNSIPKSLRHRGIQMHQQFMSQFYNLYEAPHIIFVGLDMEQAEKAIAKDTRHTLIMGIILLALGFSGITLLFLLQNYKSIKAFSDHLIENMPIGLIATHNEKIIAINKASESILGISINSFDKIPNVLLEQIKMISHEKSIIENEIECNIIDNKVIPLEVIVSRMIDVNIILFRDLTEVHSLRKEITRTQRLAMVGSLAAGVAHEVRNPLSSIKGFATYFKEKYKEVNEDQKIANIMINEVERLNRVVGQLLELSKPITISNNRVKIKSFVESSLKLIENKAQKINIKINIDSSIEYAVFDPDKLNQILLNLYLNAIEAMKGFGELTVNVLYDLQKKWLKFKVSDTGAGISQNNLPHIFDPYFTTKSTGTGLGLTIVHNIISAIGGKIEVESTPSSGTSITIFYPLIIMEHLK